MTNSQSSPQGAATRLRRAEQVYFEVSGLLPHEREAGIARLCAGDAALAQEVRELMASADRVGGFLESPALGAQIGSLADVAALTDDLLGVTLGNFRIERRIASGGMGTVYLAVRADGQFAQQVAIKVVKRGMDSEEVLRRFAAERQTLAALDHSNIARLYDAGMTPDGRPFLVMEFVDGVPIDEFCDSKRLSVKERLRLFRTVCDAVHTAHQSLVIHRDLKPTNILVTRDGVPKLLDFGIAKLLTGGPGAHETVDQDRRLTPEYASPEQVRGESVTTGSDVYSLGVVLYELLTGIRPYRFATRSTDEVRRIVCLEVPPAPSHAVTVRATGLGTGTKPSSTPGAAGTLAGPVASAPTSTTAATQATVPDAPRTRGVSSTRLRGLLRGDLDTIVMTALRKEPQRRYVSAEQFSADIGRYLSGMPVTARKDTLAYRVTKFVRRHAVGTTLTVAAVVLLAGATAVLYQQRQSLRAQRTELMASNARLGETRDFLVSMLSQGDTNKLGPSATLAKVLADARQQLRESPPADLITRASLQQAIGRSLMHLGELTDARELLAASAQAFASLLPADSQPNIDAREDLAVLKFFEGDAPGAEKELRAILSDERARNGGVASKTESELLNNIGACLRVQKRGDEALAVQREALAVRQKLFGDESLESAESHNNIASALFVKGDYGGAAGEYEAALKLRLAKLPPDHPLVVRTKSNLGLVLSRSGSPEQAIAHLSEAFAAWDKAFGADHPGRVAVAVSLAEAFRRLKQFDKAEDTLRSALAWQQVRAAGDTTQIAATEANIGVTLAEAGRDSEATPILERTLPVVESAKLAGITRIVRESLVGVYERSGRNDDANRLRAASPGR